MEEVDRRDLETLLSQVEDPRVERTTFHRLRDIILLRQETSSRVGIKAKRLKAGWNNDFLLRVLDGVNEMRLPWLSGGEICQIPAEGVG